MSRFPDYQPKGVIPATLLAFDPDLSINEAESRRHLRFVADTPGITAITVNGHASEIHACTFDEQQRILEVSLEVCGDELPLINGVYADGSQEAARVARMAERAGASALLVFPPQSMSMGGQLRPEMALGHFRTIADATDLPLIVFQYPAATGVGYPFDTLMRMVDEIPSIRAIKDWCNDPALHERHIQALQGRSRPVNVLTTHSAWLLGSLCMGPAGLLSGAGSVVADLQVAMFQAVQAGDLPAAQAINERYRPMAQAFYSPPFLDMHNRMKECLVMLDRLDRAVVRPPLAKLSAAELARLRSAIDAAGLRPEGAWPKAEAPLRAVGGD
ncbi:MAG: dihydrodipicolinate synthase family protein [Ectothiorhodospiraceae bacterium]|nr:dihydrodipicolinate synthase family protein [Ectothiorhodospiraceae bacterium]